VSDLSNSFTLPSVLLISMRLYIVQHISLHNCYSTLFIKVIEDRWKALKIHIKGRCFPLAGVQSWKTSIIADQECSW